MKWAHQIINENAIYQTKHLKCGRAASPSLAGCRLRTQFVVLHVMFYRNLYICGTLLEKACVKVLHGSTAPGHVGVRDNERVDAWAGKALVHGTVIISQKQG